MKFTVGSLFLVLILSFQNGFSQKKNEKTLNPYPEFDFSLAGYHLGKELPSRSFNDKKVFKVVDFGAIPNDGKDDIDAIQAAVNAAEAANGGIVLFPQGVFDFDVETSQKFIHVSMSNIVLRGYGEGVDGTILHDHHASRSPDSTKKWLGGTYPSFFKVGKPIENPDSILVARLEDAAFGSLKVKCKSGFDVKPGTYAILQTNPEDSSLTKELIFPLRTMGSSHARQEAKFRQMVTVVSVENGVLKLDAPINWRLLQKWKPRLVKLPSLIQEVGIENFRLITDWKETFYHHKNDVHDSGWDHIHLSGVENGWVRNIVHDSPSGAIALTWCKNSVVYDCQIIGNRGHNGFALSGGSTRNLFFKLKGGSTMHTYSMNGYCSGNVFFMCFTEAPTAIDCHGSLCLYNLFDNIYGAVIQNGGNKSALPPAHAHGFVLYNFNAGYENAYNFRIVTNIFKTAIYPGSSIFGFRSKLGYPISIEDENGIQHFKDFNTPFIKANGMNYSGNLTVPSLFQWHRKQRYSSGFPTETENGISDED